MRIGSGLMRELSTLDQRDCEPCSSTGGISPSSAIRGFLVAVSSLGYPHYEVGQIEHYASIKQNLLDCTQMRGIINL